MSDINEDQPQDPKELQKKQEGKEQGSGNSQSLKNLEQNGEELKPGDEQEWEHEAFDKTLTFIMPSALEYRRAIPSEGVSGRDDGTIEFKPSIVDPLLEDYVRPAPDMEKLTPAKLYALETAFFNFIKSFRGESESKTGS